MDTDTELIQFLKFDRKMRDNTDYLKMEHLTNGYCYKIYANNAYVGVWQATNKIFMISRYKMGGNSYLCHEYHWDMGRHKISCGTAKPIDLIERFPFEIKASYSDSEDQDIRTYLEDLEETNPVIPGMNSLQQRRQAAINWELRLKAQSKFAQWLKEQGITIIEFNKKPREIKDCLRKAYDNFLELKKD